MLELASTILDDQIGVIIDLYRRRRDAVVAALRAYMPPGVSWTEPEGGMYIWVTLPSGVDGAVLTERALREEKVAVVAGRSFYGTDPVPNTIRLAFPQTPEHQAAEGIRRLADLVRRMTPN